ncbi:uncharacterized protein [Procambarus clarkii]|uniref:uncharacterized protein n=1 Tax=Procambarus clarkii TaxID=6728 RepID=UPI001E6768F5|nr:D-arabinose dehydrogenase [NAD(P)+] heavy chain-like [Procambarus clarkii]
MGDKHKQSSKKMLNMPPIGINFTKNHCELTKQIKNAIRFRNYYVDNPDPDKDFKVEKQLCHLEIPIAGEVSDIVVSRLRKFCSKHYYTMDYFFITTSIPVPKNLDADLKLIRDLYERLDKKPVDVLYLENPVGLEGSDPKGIFQRARENPYTRMEVERDIFMREEYYGSLLITPDILQNLWAVWQWLTDYVIRGKLALNLGLKNFSQPQIEKLLQECECFPRVVQVELNPYCLREELRQMCAQRNIVVCAIHPFGNPLCVPSVYKTALPDNSVVKKVADYFDIDPKILLLTFLFYSKIPFVLDNDRMIGIGWMLQHVPNIKVTEFRMSCLARLGDFNQDVPGRQELSETPSDEAKEKMDPLWPFCFVKSKHRDG